MLVALPTAWLAAGARPALAQHIPGIAARVNGAEISNLRLERHFEEYVKGQRRNITSMINPRVYKKLKREALDQLIERELLWQAAQTAGIAASADEVAAALARMQDELKGREAFLRRIEQAGFDEVGHAENVRRDLSGIRYLARKSAETSTVGDDEVAAFYQQNLHRFEQPESARARHLLAKVSSMATAEQDAVARARVAAWRAQLLAGADFSELARRHSDDVSAAEGGDLGEVPRGRMVKAFEEALFALQPGELSDVVRTSFGYHLIRLESRAATRTLPFDEVRDSIRKRLQTEKRAGVGREIVASLKAAARIEILVLLD